MTKIVFAFILAITGLPVLGQESLPGQVFQGVYQGTVINAGDSVECGLQSGMAAAIEQALNKGRAPRAVNINTCLNQKRREREQAIRAMQQDQRRQYEEARREQRERQRYALEQQRRLEEEARRMAPKCKYTTEQTAVGGVAAPMKETRVCQGEEYEAFMQRMTLK